MTAPLMACDVVVVVAVGGEAENTSDFLKKADRIFEATSGLQDSGHDSVQRLAVLTRRCIDGEGMGVPGKDIQYVEAVDEDTALSEATGRLVVIELIWEWEARDMRSEFEQSRYERKEKAALA